MIIFLNGASSSGKSTIAREIMRLSDRPFLHYSVDHILNFWIDQKFIALDDIPTDWIYKDNISTIIDGPHVIRLHVDLIEALSVLIQKGYDVVIDELLWEPAIFNRYIHALSLANKVYLVKVICNINTSEDREKSRDDRFAGFARTSHQYVYGPYPMYDLQVDTTSHSAKECAMQILTFVEEHQDPRAFVQTLKSLEKR